MLVKVACSDEAAIGVVVAVRDLCAATNSRVLRVVHDVIVVEVRRRSFGLPHVNGLLRFLKPVSARTTASEGFGTRPTTKAEMFQLAVVLRDKRVCIVPRVLRQGLRVRKRTGTGLCAQLVDVRENRQGRVVGSSGGDSKQKNGCNDGDKGSQTPFKRAIPHCLKSQVSCNL